jgi:hypothetical protein
MLQLSKYPKHRTITFERAAWLLPCRFVHSTISMVYRRYDHKQLKNFRAKGPSKDVGGRLTISEHLGKCDSASLSHVILQ